MSREPDIAFSGSIPALYDEFLGPVIFTPYAEDLTGRVRSRLQSGRLLETACGTGLVTRALDHALPAGVHIVATDLNDAMVAVAAAPAREGGDTPSGPRCRRWSAPLALSPENYR